MSEQAPTLKTVAVEIQVIVPVGRSNDVILDDIAAALRPLRAGGILTRSFIANTVAMPTDKAPDLVIGSTIASDAQ